jgi:hypothetical protein
MGEIERLIYCNLKTPLVEINGNVGLRLLWLMDNSSVNETIPCSCCRVPRIPFDPEFDRHSLITYIN